MKTQSFKFTIIFFLSLNVFARLTDNQIVVKTDQETINITTKKGYHLNAEAPAGAVFDKPKSETVKPSTKTEKLFIFKTPNKAKKAQLSFYVCDDLKTVCEQHQHTLNLKTQQIKKTEMKAEFENISNISLKSENAKPTLLVFSAPWCPACIRMQTETYNKTEVKKQTAKTNFIKLNSDVAENYELSQKFNVKAIPTLILLDKAGTEVYRWLDYQNAKSFSASLAQELIKADRAATLIENAQRGDSNAASRLAFKEYNSLNFAEALKWFSLTKSKEDLKYKLAAEVALSQENAEADTGAKLTEEYLQILQKAIALTSSRLDQIRWSLDFFEKKKELKTLTEEGQLKAKRLIIELNFLLQNHNLALRAFLESTYGSYDNFEKAELMWMKSRLYKTLEMSEEKKATDKEIVILISKKQLSDTKPGEMLQAVAYLREAGEIKKVEELYGQLIKKYSTSYVYFEKYARFLKKNNQFDKALNLMNEALKFPQGNEPQLNLLKVQILKDLNKKSEALTLLETTFKIENIQHQRFAGTHKRLTELKAELIKQIDKEN